MNNNAQEKNLLRFFSIVYYKFYPCGETPTVIDPEP